MNDRIKQAIFEELNVLVSKPGKQAEERLQQLKFTEGKKCRKEINLIAISAIF